LFRIRYKFKGKIKKSYLVVSEMEKQGYYYSETIAAADRIPTKFNKGVLSKRSRTETRKKNSQVLNTAIIIISCFFMGLAFVLEEMAPFGIAFFAVLLTRKRGKLVAFISI